MKRRFNLLFTSCIISNFFSSAEGPVVISDFVAPRDCLFKGGPRKSLLIVRAQDPVVRMPTNAKPRLKVNRGFNLAR